MDIWSAMEILGPIRCVERRGAFWLDGSTLIAEDGRMRPVRRSDVIAEAIKRRKVLKRRMRAKDCKARRMTG